MFEKTITALWDKNFNRRFLGGYGDGPYYRQVAQ
jgi:hypothetical protein